MMIFFILCLSFFTFAQDKPLYQVATSHPEVLNKIEPHLNTVTKNGRHWLVTIKESMPFIYRAYLKPATKKTHFTYVPNKKDLNLSVQNEILDYLKQIDIDKLKASVVHLSSYKTRYAGTIDNQKAVKWTQDVLQSQGYKTSLQCYETEKCSVLAEKIGTDQNAFILVVAHMDSVGKDFAGADDNATGTASLLEMARILAPLKLNKTIRFLVTNGEEINLLGARHYARLIKNEVKKFELVINMDMVGYNSNGIVELETNAPFSTLADWFASLTASYTSLKSKITIGAWGSDHVPFLDLGIPTILTIEDWSTKTPCYHQTCDKPDTINYVYQREITKLNLAAVLTKAL